MARRKNDLPIIMSHSTRTGIIVYKNRITGCRDLMIVGLNKEVPTGQTFELEDVDWVKAVLRFGDIGALKVTVDGLEEELQRWVKELDDVKK